MSIFIDLLHFLTDDMEGFWEGLAWVLRPQSELCQPQGAHSASNTLACACLVAHL